jgi:hypothetical protein
MIRPYMKAGERQVWDNIHELPVSQALIFPNPASDFLHIQTNCAHGFRWKMIDCQGQLVQMGKSFQSNEQWDISAMDAGIYVIVIESDQATQTYRWIKQ